MKGGALGHSRSAAASPAAREGALQAGRGFGGLCACAVHVHAPAVHRLAIARGPGVGTQVLQIVQLCVCLWVYSMNHTACPDAVFSQDPRAYSLEFLSSYLTAPAWRCSKSSLRAHSGTLG